MPTVETIGLQTSFQAEAASEVATKNQPQVKQAESNIKAQEAVTTDFSSEAVSKASQATQVQPTENASQQDEGSHTFSGNRGSQGNSEVIQENLTNFNGKSSQAANSQQPGETDVSVEDGTTVIRVKDADGNVKIQAPSPAELEAKKFINQTIESSQQTAGTSSFDGEAKPEVDVLA